MKRTVSLLLALVLLLSLGLVLPQGAAAAEDALDYGDAANWAYFALGEDKAVDVFLVCPTVDTRSETNSFDLNDKLKGRFINALDMEKGIYEETGRLFSPYYRQMSMNAYKLPEEERGKALEIAYGDVSAAFRWYLDHENDGRGLILAGFSQGAQMCLKLLMEYYGGDSAEAQALRENLIAVYAIGWSVTAEMAEAYPQIKPAQGETDTGVVVSFDCEDGSLTDTLVIPAGTAALSMNPLNWKTDGTPADKSLNAGAVMSTGAEPIPGLCGAYIGARGEVVVTGVDPADYPAGIDIFPEGAYHIYDYLFFFTNLRENVASRTNAWQTGLPFKDVAADAWYKEAVKHAYDRGLMTGTGAAVFSPGTALTRAQLITVLWRIADTPTVDTALPYDDVRESAWYAGAARWASAEGLLEAGCSLSPDEALTRQEAAALLWRYAKSAGADVSVGEDTNILSYTDAFDIGEGYAAPLQWAVGAGVMEGSPDGRLDPLGSLTRAQAAALLTRLEIALRRPEPLDLWAADAPARIALTAYMADITDPNSPDFIPIADRIAVFDMDGTIFCETDPVYFDHMLFLYRVTQDPDYKDRASETEKEVAAKIQTEFIEKGTYPAGMDVAHGQGVASAFAGMTLEEFDAYVQAFKQLPMPSYSGMKQGDAFYLPMVQIIEYLQANDFRVYIVSGTDRLIVRALMKDNVLDLPNSQLIGSDELIVASHQGDKDGLDYTFAEGDKLILGGEFLIKNLKMNKVAVIAQEIGQQPVLSFGNSSGDGAMANYVIHDNPCRALAFMLCCDDTVRENGSQSKADKMYSLCEQYGWIPISMRDDWTTIYGDGVTYLGGAEAPAA